MTQKTSKLKCHFQTDVSVTDLLHQMQINEQHAD